jgi:hypothetical protein
MWQQFVEQCLRRLAVLWAGTFDKRNGLGKRPPIARKNSFSGWR